MPDFIVDHTQDWMDFFGAQGHTPKPLASGVEGAVYDLGSDLVAKVWRDRRAADLMKMQGFYGDLASAGLPFATPEILRIEHANGSSVSYERKLPGQPLQDQLGLGDGEIGPATRGCVVDVLQALATVRATAGMYQLAVLDEDQPLRTAGGTFQAALLDLLDRRVARFGPVIRQRLPDFDHRYASLRGRITALATCPDAVVHGDLFGGNILVDDRARPLAVLDFGFLTTAGDPRLDAAITAGIMNMYGPHAVAITRDLTAHLAEQLDYPIEALLIYQAAYAVATSNAFTPDGSDGHFSWCLDQLRRPDISDVLGL